MTNEHNTKTNFVAENSGTIKFALVAAAIFIGLQYAYNEFFTDSKALKFYIENCTKLASLVLDLINIEHSLHYASTGIEAEFTTDLGAGFTADQTSDASHTLFVLISAIAAWPGKTVKKLIAIITGFAFIFFLNAVRLSLTLLVDVYAPIQFDLYNSYLLPAAFMISSLAYFLIFVWLSGTHPAHD